MQYLLSIDNGSQSIRALLFDINGEPIYRHKIDIEAYFSTQEGWAEQHPDYYWQKIGEACHGLWAQGANPEHVMALSVTTQRSTMICLDQNGNTLRPAITWMDEREQHDLPSMPLHWKLLIALGGKTRLLNYARSHAQSNWVAINEPDIWAKTAKYLQLSGFLHYKLSGQYKDSIAAQVGYIPYDYKKRTWAGAKQWHWFAYHLKPQQMPELVEPATEIGKLLPDAAKHLGLPAAVPIIASGSDKACELVGAGLIEDNMACLSYGTRATLNIHSKKYIEPLNNMPAYTAALPDLYTSEVAVPRGFWLVSWFKKEFALRERRKAKKNGIEAEILFDKLIKKVPAGCQGLVLQPYWRQEAGYGVEARGAIIGFAESHTRAHLYRAIIEGIVFALREGKDNLANKGLPEITRLRVSGGGSQSDAVMQISADIFNIPVERPHTFETSALGAAIISAVSLKLYPDFDSAIKQMTRQTEVFYPNKDNQKIYDGLYKKVYKNMYAHLRPLYRALYHLMQIKRNRQN